MDGDAGDLDERLRSFLERPPFAWRTREVLEQEGPFEYALVEDARQGREAVRTRLTEDLDLRRRGFLARGVRELLVTGRLAHPAVAPVHDVGLDDASRPYVVRGAAGRRRLTFDEIARRSYARDRTWPLAKVVRVLGRAAEALAFAHGRGWTHGDLGPRHVAASTDAATEVAGWAFAAPCPRADGTVPADVAISLADLAAADPSHGRAERTLGADAFTAPEVAAGDPPSPRSDVYALGALLYLALAGHAPYDERGVPRSSLEVRRDLLAGPPMAVGQRAPLAPLALRAVVRRAMAREPAERFAHAEEFRRALEAWLETNAYGSERRSAASELRAWAGRHRIAAILGATAVAFAVAWALHAGRTSGGGGDDLAQQVEEARARARFEHEGRVRAEGRRLTMLGRWLVPQDPTLAMRFALRGARLEPGRMANDVLYETLAQQREVERLYGHDEAVATIDLSADGSRLLTRDRSGLVQVFDVAGGDVLLRFVQGGDWMGSAYLAPSGTTVLSVADVSQLLAVAAESAPRTLEVADAVVGAFDGTGAHVVLGGKDGRVHVFDAATGESTATFASSDERLDAVLFLGSGGEIATLDRSGVVHVHAPDGEVAWSLDVDGDGEAPDMPGSASADAAGRRLAAWTAKGLAGVYDVASGKRLRGFGDERLAAHPPILSPDGTRVFAYLASRSATAPGAFAAVAELDSGRMLGRFQALPFLRAPVRAAFDPGGRLVALPLGESHAVGVWVADTGQPLLSLRGHDEPVTAVSFTPDGKRLWSASLDHSARAWEIHPSPAATGLWSPGGGDGGSVLEVDAGGTRAVTVGAAADRGAAGLLVAATEDGRELQDLGPGPVGRGRVAFSGDGARVARAAADGTVTVLALDTGVRSEVVLPAEAMLLLLDHEGQRLGALLADGRMLAADLDGSASRVVYDGANGLPRAASLSPDGEVAVLALAESVVGRRMIDGTTLFAFPATGASVRDVQLDPTGTRLAWVTGEGQLRIFDLDAGQQVGANLDLPRDLRGLAYAPDGASLVAWSPRAAYLLDGVDGELQGQILDLPGPLVRASFDAASEHVVTTSPDGIVRFWPRAPLDFAASRLPAPVHPGQLRQYDVGTPEERREAGDRYVDAQPSAYALYGLGRSRLLVGLHDDAALRFEASARLRPDLPWGDYGMALLEVARMADPLAAASTREASREKALVLLAQAQAKWGGGAIDPATDPLLAPLQSTEAD